MRSVLVLALLPALVPALVPAATSAAPPEPRKAVYSHRDATGDVQVFQGGTRPVAARDGGTTAPADKADDIVSITTTLDDPVLLLGATFRADNHAALLWDIKTSNALRYHLIYVQGRAPRFELDHGDQAVTCQITSHHKPRTHTIVLTVDTHCLGSPTSVRTGLLSESNGTSTYRLDDAQLDGAASSRATLGPDVTEQ